MIRYVDCWRDLAKSDAGTSDSAASYIHLMGYWAIADFEAYYHCNRGRSWFEKNPSDRSFSFFDYSLFWNLDSSTGHFGLFWMLIFLGCDV